MANRNRNRDVDSEFDLHGYTAEEMRHALQQEWPGWKGMQKVRLVHGRGDVLRFALPKWCAEMGIPFEIEANNPGSALIYPTKRKMVNEHLTVTLKDKGLSLTPEQQAEVYDPVAAQKARAAERVRQQEEERKRKTDAMSQILAKRKDESLWLAEITRLDGMERRRSGKVADRDLKPGAAVVRPPSEILHQEGWWNAELVRVADTDTDTLKVQKRTGLEKLAPPVIAQKPAKPSSQDPAAKRAAKARDFAADNALFEEALSQFDGD